MTKVWVHPCSPKDRVHAMLRRAMTQATQSYGIGGTKKMRKNKPKPVTLQAAGGLRMTNEQQAWLQAHPEYEIVGPRGLGISGQLVEGSDGHDKAGALRPDGTFAREKAVPPSLLVGIRKAP